MADNTLTIEEFFELHSTFNPNDVVDNTFLREIGVKDLSFADDWGSWPETRKDVALEQIFYQYKGIEVGAIDGLVGPQTAHARNVYKARLTVDPKALEPVKAVEAWRDDEPTVRKPRGSPWPKQRDVPKFFGRVGQNQAKCNLPFTMVIAWDTGKRLNSYSCHEKVKEPMERIWNRVLEYYGEDRLRELRLDRFGGCLNVRKMRGGSNYSMHSWGIAVDIDPDRNQLRWGKDRAAFAKPEYDKYWEFVYDEGAISLGKERNFDWMHFQFANL